jgi:RNA recognition motif-containing protein
LCYEKESKKNWRGPSYRVYVGNLEPNIKYSFDMFRELFEGHEIWWVSMKPQRDPEDPRLHAFCWLPSRKLAENLVREFNGLEWFGRKLVMVVKEKKADREREQKKLGRSSVLESLRNTHHKNINIMSKFLTYE